MLGEKPNVPLCMNYDIHDNRAHTTLSGCVRRVSVATITLFTSRYAHRLPSKPSPPQSPEKGQASRGRFLLVYEVHRAHCNSLSVHVVAREFPAATVFYGEHVRITGRTRRLYPCGREAGVQI